jgi:hypothetical protein
MIFLIPFPDRTPTCSRIFLNPFLRNTYKKEPWLVAPKSLCRRRGISPNRNSGLSLARFGYSLIYKELHVIATLGQ